MRYHAIVIGGGHNGLTAAAYLARAGRKVLVLERRHVLGGAAVTEEVFPGFRFSVCSYVVSLLRPEIIRELDLPRHGLEILPLDGTFTPMPDGDYLWRVNDHGKTRREIARHSKLDAEAYDEYGQAMVEMARVVKPILNMTPPDPLSLHPRELGQAALSRQAVRASPTRIAINQLQLMTMSAVDFLDQWFETDVLKATMSASGIIGTFLGVRSPGTAYVLLHHYMGEIDGAFRSWGFARGGTGAISNAIAGAAREAGAEIRTATAVARIRVDRRAGDGDRARQRRRDRGRPRALERRSAAHVPAVHRCARAPGGVRRRRAPLPFRGSSGKVNLALDALPDFTLPAGAGRASARRDLDFPERRVHGARLRPGEVRRVLADAVHRHGHSDAHGSVDRAAGKAHPLVLRPVRAVRARLAAPGTNSARRSATPSSTRSPSTRRTSATSSCIGRC